jgi:glucose/arabinose dehydrogenase
MLNSRTLPVLAGAAAIALAGGLSAGASEAAAAGFKLQRVKAGLPSALYVTHAPGESNRLFIVNQNGTIRILQRGRLLPGSFLNLRSRISSGGERGLLGLAFHPRYQRNGKFYVNYTDRRGNTQIVEFRRRTKNRSRTSGRRLLTVRQPFSNHNGGALAFGPDGFLYIATGDGGGGGDPLRAGQNVRSLLGKLLRIDVNGRSRGRQFRIPKGNPFRTRPGRPEIYSYGLRNPWRFSFDRARGDLWIGDVGQNRREEISFRPKGRGRGANFGWNAFEGRSRFGGALRGSRHIPPVAEYGHGEGCSVTGGYVYRGRKVPALRGRYVYGDFCTGKVWTMRAGPRPGGARDDTDRLGVRLGGLKSFGESRDGTLYVIANSALYRFIRS